MPSRMRSGETAVMARASGCRPRIGCVARVAGPAGIVRSPREDLPHRLAVLLEPLEENGHVPSDAEVPHAHVEVAPRLVGVADLGAGGDALPERRLDREPLRLADRRM